MSVLFTDRDVASPGSLRNVGEVSAGDFTLLPETKRLDTPLRGNLVDRRVLVIRYSYSSLLNTSDTVQLVSDKLARLSGSIKASRNRINKAPLSLRARDILELL